MNSVQIVLKLCKDRGISIAKLERELGFSNGYVKGLRKGNIPTDRLKKIADYFDIPMEYLYTDCSVQLDEAIRESDMNAFQVYLKSQGWIVSNEKDGYRISSDNVSVFVSSERYSNFENKIRNECVGEILGFIAESLNNERSNLETLAAAHKNANPNAGDGDTPENDIDLIKE